MRFNLVVTILLLSACTDETPGTSVETGSSEDDVGIETDTETDTEPESDLPADPAQEKWGCCFCTHNGGNSICEEWVEGADSLCAMLGVFKNIPMFLIGGCEGSEQIFECPLGDLVCSTTATQCGDGIRSPYEVCELEDVPSCEELGLFGGEATFCESDCLRVNTTGCSFGKNMDPM